MTTPAFDRLVARTKELFWSYSGPDTWDDPKEPGSLLSYDTYAAQTQAILEMTAEQVWELFKEDPTGWDSLYDLLEKTPNVQPDGHKFNLLLRLLAGVPTDYPNSAQQHCWLEVIVAPENREEWIGEPLGDTLNADAAFKAESERRWALTGQEP